MGDIQIRFAEPGDAEQIASLFASSFCQDRADLLIYGCRGASEYIRMQLECLIPSRESTYFVAEKPGDGVIAAVELRRRSNGLLLNYIAVRAHHRKQHLGGMLFSAAVAMSGMSSGQIALDVFHDNVLASQWYSRLGFQTSASTEFVELAPPCEADDGLAYVSGLPQADLCQERFGFSQFNFITRKGTFPVGRIGDTWFRLTDLAAVGSSAIFAALDLLDTGRRIFAVVPASSVPPAQVVRVLAKTHRMEANIPHLMSLLSDDYQKSRELA
jgi:predicted N-acetyltransferase YhbS